MKSLAIKIFKFITPSTKTIIATLRIVTIGISELTFLLILYFHELSNSNLLPLKQKTLLEISSCLEQTGRERKIIYD